jgi:hypothetical protein
VNISGTMIAGYFKGDGSQLTNCDADTLDGHHCGDFLYTAGSGLQLSANQFSIANAGVTTAMLADGAVTGAKLNSSGAALGQALIWDGTNVVWGNPVAGALNLPYAGLANSLAPAFWITQNGAGEAGYFTVNNPNHARAALEVDTNGLGDGILGYTTGTGIAGHFVVNNNAHQMTAIEGWTNGLGNAGYFLSGYVTPSNTTVLATLDGNGEYLSVEIAPREGDYGFIRIYCYYDNTALVCNYQYRYQ